MENLKGYAVVIVDILANTSLTPEILVAKPESVVAARMTDAWQAYQDFGENAWVIGDVWQREEFKDVPTKRSNSPYLFVKENTATKLTNQKVIVATNNGTENMCLALNKEACAVYTGSFRNLSALVDFLHVRHAHNPEEKLLILASGEIQLGERPHDRDEDYVFSLFLRSMLLGTVQPQEAESVKQQIDRIWRTEYAPLNKQAGVSQERTDGDIAYVVTSDTCSVVPQCLPIAAKPYMRIVPADMSGSGTQNSVG